MLCLTYFLLSAGLIRLIGPWKSFQFNAKPLTLGAGAMAALSTVWENTFKRASVELENISGVSYFWSDSSE